MFTSRAEHRLSLRQDNADRRLMKKGLRMGLIPSSVYERLQTKEDLVAEGRRAAEKTFLSPSDVNPYLQKISSEPIAESERLLKILRRPDVSLEELFNLNGTANTPYVRHLRSIDDPLLIRETVEQLEIEIKYEGYIQRQQELINRFDRIESEEIPRDLDYAKVRALSTEGRERLTRVMPSSIGQASRISGVTPSDVSVLMVYLKK
jgi:tRNA uridine 5-carboxymethylaminomethyl modification enzyme